VNLKVFYELFRGLSYRGPGSEECTRRALDAVGELPDDPRILDVGCGAGHQTLVLAGHCGGRVLAIDIDPNSLEELRLRAADANLTRHIETQVASMTELDFPDESFDLIWSEGAIYNMGFERGLSEWRRFLRPGGCIAVTELSWLSDDPPGVAREFWESEYPGMASREENTRSAERAKYQPVDSFALPDTAWSNYYGPLEERIALLRGKYASVEDAQATLDSMQREIDVFRASEGSYSYVFYVARRPR
jgi:SAM-dependent methyltransferase